MEDQMFRHAPARPVLQVSIITWLAGLTGVVAMYLLVGLKLSLFMLGSVGTQPVLLAAILWPYIARCGVRVGPTGVAAVAPFVADRLVRWDDIHAVRRRHILLVANIVSTGPGRPLAFPFAFRDPEGFAEAVAEFAGGDHPLAVAAFEELARET